MTLTSHSSEPSSVQRRECVRMYHPDARPRLQERNWFELCSNNNFASGRGFKFLLVIVHYLLKNNIRFNTNVMHGRIAPNDTYYRLGKRGLPR